MLHHSLTIALGALWVSGSSAQSPPPYPDLVSSISLHPGSVPVLPDADFSTWVIEDGVSSSSFEADGLTFTLTAQDIDANGPVGTLTGGVNDEVYTTPFSSLGERMVGAGITPAEDEGALKLTISGLPSGQHRLTTWFNSWSEDEVSEGVLLTVNGEAEDFVYEQSIRGRNWNEASLALFNVNGGPLEIVFTPAFWGTPGNIYFTGFEINAVNAYDSIAYPSPANRETDVAAPNGELVATWAPGREAPDWSRDYKVYFGASVDELQLVATQREREVLFTGLESGSTYYWRVDLKYGWESDALFDSGRTLQFTVA